jgi:Na+/H+ antiporter NhaD/arsenite permease-like protein
LLLLTVLVVAKIATVLAGVAAEFRLTYIAVTAALPIIAFVPRRPNVLKGIDWFTLVFFAAMFVLMASVWNSGYIQSGIGVTHLNLVSTEVIWAASVVLSQFISNVPLVALYLPLLT